MHTGTWDISLGKQPGVLLGRAVIKVRDVPERQGPRRFGLFVLHSPNPSCAPPDAQRPSRHWWCSSEQRTNILPSRSFLSRGKRQAINKEISETYSVLEGDKKTAEKGERELGGGSGVAI